MLRERGQKARPYADSEATALRRGATVRLPSGKFSDVAGNSASCDLSEGFREAGTDASFSVKHSGAPIAIAAVGYPRPARPGSAPTRGGDAKSQRADRGRASTATAAHELDGCTRHATPKEPSAAEGLDQPSRDTSCGPGTTEQASPWLVTTSWRQRARSRRAGSTTPSAPARRARWYAGS